MDNHTDNTATKRLAHHSDSNSSKRIRVHPHSPDSHPPEFQLDRVDSDLLDMLNDADNVTERDPTVLDSVIKSFENEILAPPEPEAFKPNLGYLLEASDDELGLPPPTEGAPKPQETDSGRVGPEGLDLTGFFGFEDDVDGLRFVGYDDVENSGGGYLTIDGLFDHPDAGADILWRSESLQAM
ncbi:hypothetical protein Fmac_003778 [Flemingia macrophylla]|uniref:Uncharacterized protein n=1 Tax=Flemingia macrophylla TaxID=520843 RepID=A0ABD1N335_9FABA